jgi:hypothetical protein
VLLSVAIMTHPRRHDAARSLVRSCPPGTRIVVDPEPDGPPTALRTTLLAWDTIPDGATHQLLLQDDISFGHGFFGHVEKAIQQFPDAALSFYANWNSRNGAAVRMAVLSGAGWARAMPEYTPCVALALPRSLASGFIEYAAPRAGDGWSEDVLMSRYLAHVGATTLIAAPNLVEHADESSIAANELHGVRRSACYGLAAEVADIGTMADFPVVPFYKRGIVRCVVRDVGSRRWSDLTVARFFARSGHAVDELAGLTDTAVTAYCMAIAGGTAAAGSLGPVGRRALDTVGAGGLCEAVDSGEEPQSAEFLRDAAHAGFLAGRAATESPRRHSPPPQVRCVLLGGQEAVAEGLRARLADLGVEVVDEAEHVVMVILDDAEEPLPAGESASADHESTTVRVRNLFGPDGPADSLLASLVLNALLRRPVTAPAADPAEQGLRVTSMDGLAEAIHRILVEARRPERTEISEHELTGRELAAAASRLREPIRSRLDKQVHDLAQWIAYRESA